MTFKQSKKSFLQLVVLRFAVLLAAATDAAAAAAIACVVTAANMPTLQLFVATELLEKHDQCYYTMFCLKDQQQEQQQRGVFLEAVPT